MSKDVVDIDLDVKFSTALERMINENVGAIPVVSKSGELEGIITEHDIVRYLSGRAMTEKVGDYMSRHPVMASTEISIKSAARLMVSNSFWRIPLIDGNTVLGILTTVDLERYIGEGSAFRKILLDEMDQVMSLPVREIMRTGVFTVKSDLQLGEAAPLIRTSGVGAVLVEDGGDLAGILTERDLLTALVIE